MNSLNFLYVVLVAVAAIVLPLAWRLLSSPLTFLVLSPFLFSFVGLVSFFSYIPLGYFLDTANPQTRFRSAYAARPLAFSTPAAWQAVLTRSQWAYKPPQSLPPIYPPSPIISTAVNDILIMVVRDFVLTWYRDISSSPSFPTSVSSNLHASLERTLQLLEPLDLPSILVKRILPKITVHVEQFRESEIALRGAGLERRLTESEELDMLLASRYASKGGGRLHQAVENLSSGFTKQSEEAHLRKLVDRILPVILPPSEAQSKAVRIVVREIVACCVLYPLMDMLSDPDFWNQKIDSLAGAAIRQQRLISKVRNVLETQLPSRPESKAVAATPATPETITVRTDMRQFESFLRSISRTSSLLDARRLKNDIVVEVRRTRALLANHEREDWINGEKTEDIVAYLDRLYTAKRKAEERIVELGGHEESKKTLAEVHSSPQVTLREVLSNPTSLSYFMEFLDRRDRSLLVQFWLTVESFKDPLESVDSDSDRETLPGQISKGPSTSKEDIIMIHDLYFSNPNPHPALSAISSKHSEIIREFANTEGEPSASVLTKARRSVLRAQRQVERAMEQDFEEFERSELWFRVVEDIVASRGTASGLPQEPLIEEASPLGVKRTTPFMQRAGSSPSLRFPSNILTGRSSSTGSSASTPPDAPFLAPVKTAPSSLDLLMSSEAESTNTVHSRAPLFDDPNNVAHESHEKQSTVAAIQAALTDIIALDNQQSEGRRPMHIPTTGQSDSRDSLFLSPNLRRTFSEDSSHADSAEDEREAKHEEEARIARPGDLQLSHEISRLSDKLSALQSQDAMLDTLVKKAELAGDAQEIRLLRKSKSAVTREMREMSFQKAQYEQQDVANRLVPERTRLSIVNAVQGEESGKSVVRYLVEVQQLALDGTIATGWVVARRYNEFLNMHTKLRDRFALVRTLDFPRKHLVTALSASFVDTRRTALEKYIQNLVLIPAVCESDELRTFLSRNSPFIVADPEPAPSTNKLHPVTLGSNLVRSMYNAVTGSVDDMFFGPSMLDVMLQRLTRQAAELAGIVGNSVNDEDVVTQALRASGKTAPEEALLHVPGDFKPLDGETSTSMFTAPISDLILAVFELNKKNNWLRRQAIVVILQQVLGSTVEKKLREIINIYLSEPQLINIINMVKDGIWPGGKLSPPSIPRSREEKLRVRDEANRKLSALIPDLAANMIGRSNARRGARRIFAVLQNRRLNQHIVYTVLDEVISAIFTDVSNSA